MKIYTKTGDKGNTSLIGGTRVPKHHHRIEAYGTVDEVNAQLGLVNVCFHHQKSNTLILQIQKTLFVIGSHLASDPERSKMKLPDLHNSDIELLEKEIDEMQNQLPELKSFILPGGNLAAAQCHIARCVCRRAERRIVLLAELEKVDDKIISYFNRLSDYLFVLSRFICFIEKNEEIKWVSEI